MIISTLRADICKNQAKFKLGFSSFFDIAHIFQAIGTWNMAGKSIPEIWKVEKIGNYGKQSSNFF